MLFPRFKIKNQSALLVIAIITILFGSYSVLVLNKIQINRVYYAKTTDKTPELYSSSPVFGKYVTKSMVELGQMDRINRNVVFFNQVPNCGAELLVFLLQKLQGFNNYRHVRLKGEVETVLSKIEEVSKYI